MTRPFAPITRVVTGHDADGRAVVSLRGPLPAVEISQIPGTRIRFVDIPSDTCRPCRMLFVPVDGACEPALKTALAR